MAAEANPAAQLAQLVALEVSSKVPAAQLVHNAAPAAEYWPAVHGAQPVPGAW